MHQYTFNLPSSWQLAQSTLDELLELATKIASSHANYISSASPQSLSNHAYIKHGFGIFFDKQSNNSVPGILQRLSCRNYWLDQLKNIANKSREEIAVKSGSLGPAKLGKQPHCSDESFKLAKLAGRKTQKLAAQAAHQKYMTILGYSEAAFENGFRSLFITLTCPAEFHSSSTKYTYKTFEDGHNWLNNFYQSLFGYVSRKAKSGIDFWGIRTVEVHADGCPHWHILVYAKSEVEQLITNRLRSLYERESDELKNYYTKHHAEIIQTRSATNYAEYKEAISYIFKNSYAGSRASQNANEMAMRQRVAISCAGRHQYQLIGIRGASKVKELRRQIKRDPNMGGHTENLIVKKNVINRNRLQLDALKNLLFGELKNYVFLKETYKNTYGEIRTKTSNIIYRTKNLGVSKVERDKKDDLLTLCLEVFTGFFTFCVGVILNSSSAQSQPYPPELSLLFIATDRHGWSACIRAPPNITNNSKNVRLSNG